ncbi:membrane protein [Mycolicibacterium neoaurum]|uniref:Membrane protein n=2 Tax=Mycobacteriaceae TaxID=1762 RepID=V5X6Q6_MYCNE|nr:membrane protein [Mycolicibacterium neoaurum VKM Ac-1815D]AMO04777.1 membrane protein [Mycolicibacterium neoaurum]KJQ51884.1 membrane protein [Mycolicibacterium neoaurum]KUM10350.1 hypothetical protein AVZ31_01350 [Mycolicibacterium neoaurum]
MTFRAALAELWRRMPRMFGDGTETRRQRVIRRVRVGIVIAACVVTFQSVLLVLGAWENDRRIESDMGVAAAEVLDAGPRRSTIEFVTPDRVTYRPELGVLYPSELEPGMRIYVEYDRSDPDLVRVQDRNAALAIIPAASIAVLGWLIAGAALLVVAVVARRVEGDEPVGEQTGGQAGGQAEDISLSSQSAS